MGKFVIYDKDEEYARRVYEYLCDKLSGTYEVLLFTEEDALDKYTVDNEVDILLSVETKSKNVGIRVRHLIILSEDRDAEEGHTVFKYGPADDLLRKIMSICAAGTAADSGFERKAGQLKVIGIYTPIKRCFQTTFALTLGQILAGKSRTLYLNFESFSGFEMIQGKENEKDLMDLLYFSESEPETFSYRVSSMAEHIGRLDYIQPVRVYGKYREVSKEQWLRLLDCIRNKTDYECLILDLSEQVVGLFDVLKECGRIFTIVDDERMADAKVAQYENMLNDVGYQEILDKTSRIKIPKFTRVPKEFELLPYTELADYVRKLVETEVMNGL